MSSERFKLREFICQIVAQIGFAQDEYRSRATETRQVLLTRAGFST